MLYCISDIHGEYDLFIKLLKKINFSFNDEMIILGDIIDKGNESLLLAKLVFNMPNIKVIMGNHEYEFCKYYYYLKEKNLLTSEKLKEFFEEEGDLLDLQIVNKIIDLPFYIETDNVIYTHAGVLVEDNQIVSLDKTEVITFAPKALAIGIATDAKPLAPAGIKAVCPFSR